MLAIGQTLFVCLTGSLLTTDVGSNLLPGCMHSNCTLTAFCFESLSPSEDKIRHVCYTLVIIIPHKFSAIYDTMDTSKEVGCTALIPFPISRKFKMIRPSVRSYSHHHHQIGLNQHNSLLVKV